MGVRKGSGIMPKHITVRIGDVNKAVISHAKDFIRFELGNAATSIALHLNAEEAETVAHGLNTFVAALKKDPMSKHVDMRDIKAIEIREHWQKMEQHTGKCALTLNHLEQLQSDNNQLLGKIEYVFGQVLESLTTAREGQKVRDEEVIDLLKAIESRID